jgi:hypothetical protein
MESQILALKKAWTADWYFKCKLLLQIPIVTSNTNCYFEYQLLLRIPIVTLNTNRVTIHQEEEQDEQQQQQQQQQQEEQQQQQHSCYSSTIGVRMCQFFSRWQKVLRFITYVS